MQVKYQLRISAHNHQPRQTEGFMPCCADCRVRNAYIIDGVRMTYEKALIYLCEVSCMTTREAIGYLRRLTETGGAR